MDQQKTNALVRGNSFKDECPLNVRKELYEKIKINFPDKIPVIVQKHKKCTVSNDLSKRKFLLSPDTHFGQFVIELRKKYIENIKPSEALFWYVGEKDTIPTFENYIGDIYNKYKDKDDGFLYVTFTNENVFGENYFVDLSFTIYSHNSNKCEI